MGANSWTEVVPVLWLLVVAGPTLLLDEVTLFVPVDDNPGISMTETTMTTMMTAAAITTLAPTPLRVDLLP